MQVEAAREARLRAPHSFPLERLLAVFYCLSAAVDGEDEEGEDRSAASAAQREEVRWLWARGMGAGQALLRSVCPALHPADAYGRPCRPAGTCPQPAAHPALLPASPPCPLQARRAVQQAEVLHQVSSLVSLRLLEQSGNDALEGQTYRCGLGDDAATELAANVRLRLADYLKLS